MTGRDAKLVEVMPAGVKRVDLVLVYTITAYWSAPATPFQLKVGVKVLLAGPGPAELPGEISIG